MYCTLGDLYCCRYYRHYLSVMCEFIPQVLFLLAIFGYLCALIFVKWIVSVDYPYISDFYNCSPNLLIGKLTSPLGDFVFRLKLSFRLKFKTKV